MNKVKKNARGFLSLGPNKSFVSVVTNMIRTKCDIRDTHGKDYVIIFFNS